MPARCRSASQLPTKWIVVLYQPAARGRDWIITHPIARHGQRPHNLQRDRTGTWAVSGLAIGVSSGYGVRWSASGSENTESSGVAARRAW